MPEAPAVASSFAIDLPPQDVPINQGEERSQAMLNMEDQKRKAASIQDLRAMLEQLEGKSPARTKSLRHQKLVEKWNELKGSTRWDGVEWHGPCAPATVINFNPVDLRLYGELDRWTIPAAGAGKGEFNDSGTRVKISFNGRSFAASYVTLTNPHVWPAITDAHDSELGIKTSIEARYIPPIGLAHQFYEHYVSGASDAQGMGGVLIFQGNIHTLDAKRMKQNEGKILVPVATLMAENTGRVVYEVVQQSFEDCLEACLTQQRNYANAVIAEGHSYATSSADAIKNQLSRYHILWHNWAMDRGYKRDAETWASERLDDSPNIEAVHCPDCHQRQASVAQYFCPNCNAPFDACKAFLAGKAVSPDRLASYDADSPEFAAILAESNRRQKNIAKLALPSEPKAAKAKEPKTT